MNDLHDLLHDAVSDVEPSDRLTELRARTTTPARAARPWFWAAGATVLATAAAVAVLAVVGDRPAPGHDHHMAMDPPASTQLVAAYFIGDPPGGEARLYREFDEVATGDPLQRALERIELPAGDPDYRTTWAPGSFESATLADGTIEVELGDAGPPAPEGIAAQQLVYTLQAAVGGQLPVQLVDDGEPVGEPYQAAPQLDVLSPVSISDPAEGNDYAGTMVARGRARSEDGRATWELMLDGVIVRSGTVDVGPTMTPWEVTIDLSGFEPGSYVFELTGYIPPDTSASSYSIPPTDTRTISVR